MTRRKTLKELTIKDNFMFGAVMCNEDLCKQLLELILGFSIERVEVSKEKCMDIQNRCIGFSDLELADGSETIFLSTKGCDDSDVCPELVKFLDYVGANLEESTLDFKNDFVEKLQKKVSNIKLSRRMEERYMLTELLMQDERKTGRKESILDILSELGDIPDELRNQILFENRMGILKEWTKLAARAESIDQFMDEM